MTIRSIAASFAVASLVLVSGCSNSRNDVSYDDIGETRVFERESHVATTQPRQQGMTESVPAPAPIVEAPKTVKPKEIAKKVEKAARKSSSNVATAPERHRVLIGEMDMDQ